MASILSIAPRPASQPGAVSGHEARCSCGLLMTTSLGLTEIQFEAARHIEWHQKAGR